MSVLLSILIGLAGAYFLYNVVSEKKQSKTKEEQTDSDKPPVKKKNSTWFYLLIFIILALKFQSVLNHNIDISPFEFEEPPPTEKVVRLS